MQAPSKALAPPAPRPPPRTARPTRVSDPLKCPRPVVTRAAGSRRAPESGEEPRPPGHSATRKGWWWEVWRQMGLMRIQSGKKQQQQTVRLKKKSWRPQEKCSSGFLSPLTLLCWGKWELEGAKSQVEGVSVGEMTGQRRTEAHLRELTPLGPGWDKAELYEEGF